MDLEIFKASVILAFALVLFHSFSLKKGEKPSLWTVVFIFIGSFAFILTLAYLESLYENSAIKEKRRAQNANEKRIVMKD